MATRRRATSRTSRTTRRARTGSGFHMPVIDEAVTRSLVGIVLLVVGIVTLIGLALQGQGRLTDWWRDSIAPWFGSVRVLFPLILLACGGWLEWRRPETGWRRRLVAAGVAYVALLGIVGVLATEGGPLEGKSGGRIGDWIASWLPGLITYVGALLVLTIIGLAALALALDRPLRALFAGPLSGMKDVGVALLGDRPAGTEKPTVAVPVVKDGAARGAATKTVAPAPSPGQTGAWDDETAIPAAALGAAPNSATFAPPRGAGGAAAATLVRPIRDLDDVTDAADSPPTKDRIDYVLPPLNTLDDIAVPLHAGGDEQAHILVEDIIVKKLGSFGIPVRIVGRNAGPVVTQYEVEPAPDVKVSRIEALSDDLSMALAARSLRIEAPIPGKRAVGIEIPNKDFNVVALRRILEELDFKASGSTLTFALGRDVAGKAQAVDLAKMPHLLIAGATGSGKSVMVNALITSLLCEATPDDVRMILMDLKRVELAAYNGLPHLLVPVITEPERAKAALKWAVNEMEARYRRLAGATARNIRAFNETRADPDDRMPYIVIIIDELADLMMREGKNVEDPIVRLAQKARATGIHMVLATQRPSVNVVTGLIKANFPSRDRVRHGLADQFADDPRHARRGGPHRARRHALPTVRPAASDAPPGSVRVRRRDRSCRGALEGPDRGSALRHGHHRYGRRGDRLERRPDRRGRRSPPPGCHRGDSGVRSGFGVAPPASPQGRLRTGRPDDRPTGGSWIHRGVRWFERSTGPPPR